MTVHHITPRPEGSHDPRNLVTPCATCHEARDAAGLEPGQRKPAPGQLLPMYEAPPRPENVEPAERYAVIFKWNDGHKSGIYSWDFLRRHCQCDACRG